MPKIYRKLDTKETQEGTKYKIRVKGSPIWF